MCPGAARGPPGMDGVAGVRVVFGGRDCVAAIGMGRCFVRTLVVDDVGCESRLPLSLRMLVLRPSDAKNPVPELFEPGSGICNDFVGERMSVELRAGGRCS